MNVRTDQWYHQTLKDDAECGAKSFDSLIIYEGCVVIPLADRVNLS